MADFIFVVGIGRSGTSMLQNMLNAHDDICFLPENSFVRRYLGSGRFNSRVNSVGPQHLASELASDVAFKRLGIAADELEQLLVSPKPLGGPDFFRAVANKFAGANNACTYIGDKDPRAIEFLPMINASFPGARIIHIYRDPRDVVLSKTKADWSKDRSIIANLFAGRVQWSLVRRYGRESFGSRFYELAYEDLIGRPEVELAKICDFLKITFVPELLNPGTGGRLLVAADEMSWKQKSLGPVLSENSEKWRSGLTPEQIALTESVTRRMLDEAGYEPSTALRSLGLLDKTWVLAQATLVSLIEPLYCWYRMWSQRT